MRALVVTNMYPTARFPHAGPFIATQVESLREAGIAVDVVHFDRTQGRSVYWRVGANVRRRAAATRPDLVHVVYGGVLASAVTRALPDYPVLVSYCGSDLLAGTADGDVTGMSARLGARASRRAARRADGIIVKSRNLLAALPRGLDGTPVWVVPNGVDVEKFRPLDRGECAEQLGWERGRRHVLFPAPPHRLEKRYALARAAVDHLNRRGLIAELHALDGVRHEDVPVWLNAADAVLLTSTHEGSPNAVKEALACNVPVVSVDVGDVRERIEGVRACSIAEADAADLAEKLGRSFGETDGVDGRSRVLELSLERTADRVLEVYRAVATGGAAAVTRQP